MVSDLRLIHQKFLNLDLINSLKKVNIKIRCLFKSNVPK